MFTTDLSRLSRLLPVPLVVIAGLWSSLAPAAAEATDGTAVIVFDGSGSMWGTVGTERAPKFEQARGALREALSTLSPRVRLGLMSFGHRRRGDCSDVEVLAQPAAGSAEAVLALTDKINPRGKGPLSATLREAAKLIPAEEAGSIIAIHDGLDNCAQDTCAVAADIAKANPRTRLFLVGFGLPAGEAQRLACVARETNGRVLTAQDATALKASISEALTLANLETGDPGAPLNVPAPQAATPPEKAAGAPGLKLTASLAADGGPVALPVRWTVAAAEKPDVAIKTLQAPTLSADLPPGRYQVEARLGYATARQALDVGADGPTVARLALDAGTLKIEAQADQGGAPLAEPVVTVTAKADGSSGGHRPVWIGREATAELVLPAGDYQVRVQDGLSQQTTAVTLAAGTRQEVKPVLGTGRLELSAVDAGDGKPLTGVTYVIEEDDPDSPEGRREVARSADLTPAFTLPAGTYYVLARSGSVEVNDRVAVGSGDTVKHAASLNIVRLSVSAVVIPAADTAGGDKDLPVVIRILTLDARRQEIARANGAAGEFELPAQRYVVEAALSGMNIKSVGSVDLTSARDMNVQIKLESGEVSVAPDTAGARHWRLKDSSGRTVLHSGPGVSAGTRLAPGRYVLLDDSEDAQAEDAFELKAGERRVLTPRSVR